MSTLSDLRHFRMSKTSNNTVGNIGGKVGSGRKRIRSMSDSSDEEPSKKVATDLSVAEKEFRLIKAKERLPGLDSMIIQDALFHANWEVDTAVEQLIAVKGSEITQGTPNQLASMPKATQSSSRNTILYPANNISAKLNGDQKNGPKSSTNDSDSSVQRPKKKKRRDSSSDDNDGAFDGNGRPRDRVFDSEDESDDETSYYMTADRKNVLNFLNEAKSSEFLVVKGFSTKKIDILFEHRPFVDWFDLINKLQTNKHLSTDMLNACQEFLNQRNNMGRIIEKCGKLVKQLEATVAQCGSSVQQPKLINPELSLTDYQLVGLNWLAVIHSQNMNGILADEMGLGKTIQVIAFLAYLKESQLSKKTHLIVVPSSTMDNWGSELAKWCPDLVVEKYYGNMNERRALRIEWSKGGLEGVDVVLTTYHMVASSPEERKMFRVLKMHYVIYDEAHMLKNMTTSRYTHLAQINAERRLLLTGTPLQNNLLELMSLLCFVMPSMFAKNTEDIKNLFQKQKVMKGDELSKFERKQIEQAKRVMKPFILRRLKSDVLRSLPLKTVKTIKVQPSKLQREKYSNLVDCYSSDAGIVKATSDASGMAIMMDMRKLSNHPLLLRFYYSDEKVHAIAAKLAVHPAYKKNRNPQYVFEELAYLSDFQLLQTMEKYDIGGFPIPDNLFLDAGKCQKLDELLPQLKKDGHRVLIFSQFTMMLDILERYLDLRKHTFLRFDGQTVVTERQDLIDQYTQDTKIFVFLLSTKAGGLGINLTAADTIIIHDIDFNPYNDKQAEDRCHRMGQKKPVTVYRLITDGTIEEGMLMVAEDKLNLEREVTDNSVEQEHKCMVRLLTTALGIKDENKVESMMSPKKTLPASHSNGHANDEGDC